MADRVEVEVQGVEEFAAGVSRLAGKIEDAANDEFGKVADSTANALRGSLPRLSGRTAASVAVERQGGARVGYGEGVPWAQYVEFGGRGHPHSTEGNYLAPAVRDADRLLVQAGERAATKEIGAMSW